MQNALIAALNLRLRTDASTPLNASGEEIKVIWRFSDGRPGHDAQSKGLSSALSDLLECECHDILSPVPFSNYCWGALKKFPLVNSLPDPDLLIGAGHATHKPMLLAQYTRGGLAIVLMKPSLPTKLFDLCLIPEHDKHKGGDNILTTVGPLNLLRPSGQLSDEQGLILIGGESKHFHWENAGLQEQLLCILERSNLNWTLTDSPRTPPATRALLQELNTDKVKYVPYADKNGAGIVDLLQRAGTVWVSEDSMSMIYEALSTGAAVGVLRVTNKNNSRLADVAQRLANKHLLTLFDEWVTTRTLLPPEKPLYESARCAKELVRRLSRLSARPS